MRNVLTKLFCLMMTAMLIRPALVMAEHSLRCDTMAAQQKLPSHFCECYENAEQFGFPIEREVKDTMWYVTSIDNLQQGLSAYWFADCSVSIDVFAFCTSHGPAFSVTVPANRMAEIDNTMVNQMIEELGEQAKNMAQTLSPRVRVCPNGGSGKVYCYPYDQGPESTCEDPLPFYSRMTYVCEKPYNVYRLPYSRIPASGKTFIHWKQKKNLPCEVRLTLDSCNGEEIGRATLSDSLHIYQPDSVLLLRALTRKKSVWLHVTHEDGYAGRIYLYTTRQFVDPLPAVSQKTCLGKKLTVDQRAYESDTTFTDTLWVSADTLQTRQVSLRFTQPKLEYDTIRVAANDLRYGYRYTPSGTILYAYGDTIVEVKKANTCTRRIALTVKRPGEAVETVETGDPRTYKQLHNGQLFIIVDDRKYNVFGQSTK